MPKQPKSEAMFYWDRGLRADAELHEPIITEGDSDAADEIGREVMRELGLSEEQIATLFARPLRNK